MKIPDRLNITIFVGAIPVAKMLVMINFVACQKNAHNLGFGPSDINGKIYVTREQILAEARKNRELFLMDYAAIETAWTGTLIITPMNREAIRRARSAVQLFGSRQYAYNHEEILSAAERALAQLGSGRLTASVQCDGSSDMNIETITVNV